MKISKSILASLSLVKEHIQKKVKIKKSELNNFIKRFFVNLLGYRR